MALSRDRIDDVVAALTRAEKLSLVRGDYPETVDVPVGAAGYLPAVDRIDVPALRFADGPLGVRGGESTAFPATLALGATFDPDLARRFGSAMGREARAKGIDVLLAPGCNLIRVPQCGRAFEYFGEDPIQTARLTGAVVEGIQTADVSATAKHYVANSQETERVRASSEVSERALRECYLPAFEAAVDADVAAVMAGYHRINGTYATAHRRLLTDVLKDEFGFDGPVMSDWWAVRDATAAAKAGLDIEMPGVGALDLVTLTVPRLGPLRRLLARWPSILPSGEGVVGQFIERTGPPGNMPPPTASRFARALPDALASGTLSEARLDDMVRRVLTLHARVAERESGPTMDRVDLDAHRELAERLAIRGTVLLTNDADVLPLDPTDRLAVIGPNVEEAKVGGGGSSEVTPRTSVSPLEGIRERHEGVVETAAGHPRIEAPSLFELDLSLPRFGGDDTDAMLATARQTAASADVAIVVVQDVATEGEDRASLSLPDHQDDLITEVAGAAERTVVVLQTAGPVLTPWLDAVDAVIQAWYPGQEAGAAIAAVLEGDSDPSGRLPVTFAEATEDYPTSEPRRYPGVTGDDGFLETHYEEGVFVGYRHFDEAGITPTFPFGHGLSYASFEFKDLAIDGVDSGDVTATVRVRNTADRPGREVVQVYVAPVAPAVPRPPRELAGFHPIRLGAGEERELTINLDGLAFAYYDESSGAWAVDAGEHRIEVGRSSRDCRLNETISVDSTILSDR